MSPYLCHLAMPLAATGGFGRGSHFHSQLQDTAWKTTQHTDLGKEMVLGLHLEPSCLGPLARKGDGNKGCSVAGPETGPASHLERARGGLDALPSAPMRKLCTAVSRDTQLSRIQECVWFEGTFNGHLISNPARGREHLSLDEGAPSPV